MSLSKSQKKYLAGVCHHLRPVVTVGHKGLSETVGQEIEIALDAHELIKIKLRGDREERAGWIARIPVDHDCELIQKIGMTACFFRRNADKPKLELPR